MKLNEIFDDTQRAQRVADMMKSIEKQYGAPRTSRTPTADQVNHSNDYRAKRAQAEQALERIAQNYTADQFDQFKEEALSKLPLVDKLVDLQWAFDFYNPERREQRAASWNDYGKLRQQNDPSVVSNGPTGHRNWTGD